MAQVMLTIRASSLPEFADCARRYAARHLPETVKAAGHRLRETAPGIAAAIGSAVHEGARVIGQAQIATRKPYNIDYLDAAIESLRAGTVNGIVYDDVSPRDNDAQKQVLRLMRVYIEDIAEKIRPPEEVEAPYAATFPSGTKLTGHADRRERLAVRDLKTGRMVGGYMPQFGGYVLLARAHGHKIEFAYEDHIQRTSLKKPQARAKIVRFDASDVVGPARAAIRGIERGVAEFRKTGSRYEFIANPSSMLCSARWCPAHGTTFCNEWREK